MSDPLKDILIAQAAASKSAMDEGAAHERRKLDAIIAAYDRALADPKVVLPAYLHAAIEAARK